jgi:hypothetical protein
VDTVAIGKVMYIYLFQIIQNNVRLGIITRTWEDFKMYAEKNIVRSDITEVIYISDIF